jgi:2-polyprenyl-6-methoxyphenol hydroxylase-like FAD-dependent oxidoreductase
MSDTDGHPTPPVRYQETPPRRGWVVTVIEAAEDLSGIQTAGALHLWANAIRALQSLGLAGAVAAVGLPLETTVYCDHTGRELARWPVGEIGRALDAPDLAIARKDLHGALITAAGRRPDVRLQPGTRCVSLIESDRSVRVRLSRGCDLRADLVVGADGIGSDVRRWSIAPTVRPRYSGYGQWQAVIPAAPVLAAGGDDLERIMFGRGRRAVLHPVRGERMLWEGILYGPAEAARSAGSKAMLLQELADFPTPLLAAVAATDEGAIDARAICDLPSLDRWCSRRIALIGDAAHAMTTNLSQGACQGMEDVLVLCRSLDDADVPAALQAYQARRIPRVTPLARRSRRVAGIGGWSSPVTAGLRNRVLGRALSTVALRDHRSFVAAEI